MARLATRSAKSKPSNAKEKILDAAHRVVARAGASHLTIDAVAAESAMSKGGVLYNFPTKEKLLEGMLERFINTLEPLIESYREEFQGAPNPTLRAMIAGCREVNQILGSGFGLALLATSAQNPALLAPVRKNEEMRWKQVQAECSDPAMAAILITAMKGLSFSVILGVAPHCTDDWPAMLRRMEEMALTL